MSVGTGWTGPLEHGSSMTLWGQIKEAAVPIVTYWVWVFYAYFVFTVAIALTENIGSDDILFLSAFGISTFAGVGLGQVMAFLRVRTWVLMVASAMMWTAFFVFFAAGGSALMNNDVIAAIVVSVLFLGPVAMTGGLWSLETNRSLWATWLPMVWTVGACLVWIEDHGGVGIWEEGDKYAVWDLVSMAMLVPSVGLFLLFLVTRETHRLATWRRGPTAPLRPSVEERGVSRPRITFAGLILLAAMGVGLAVVTAVVAPYLWRTGPQDGNGPNDNGGTEQHDPSQYKGDGGKSNNRADKKEKGRKPECRNGQYCPEEEGSGPKVPDGVKQAAEQVVEAAKQAGGTICSVLSIAMMLGLGALLAYRPLKRLFVLRHLRDPLWDVAPSTRIDQCWRMVEIALGDAGVRALPGEDAAGLAKRAAPVLKELSPVEVHGLEEVAEVADRVRFGLGVGPKDVEVIERFARWVLDTVWERLDDKAQLAAMYRGI